MDRQTADRQIVLFGVSRVYENLIKLIKINMTVCQVLSENINVNLIEKDNKIQVSDKR